MAVLFACRVLLLHLAVLSSAQPDEWIEAGSGELKMCAGGTAECTSAETCTYHAYGPCGGATEPKVYFEAHIEALGVVYDSEAYLTDSTKATQIHASPIANNKYISSSPSETVGDAEYAYLATGAYFGDNPAESGGFLGMTAGLMKRGTIKTKTASMMGPKNGPGRPEIDFYEMCISDLEGGECGAERTFTEGEYKFTLYGIATGSNYQKDPKTTHVGIRTKLSLVGAKAGLRINDDLQTLETIGSTDVKKIVVTEEAEDGGSTVIDFPGKYNVGTYTGDNPEGLTKPSATKDVKIKVSKGPEGEQSIYLDYLFDAPEQAGQYFIYDPTVTESKRVVLDVLQESKATFCFFSVIVPALVNLFWL